MSDNLMIRILSLAAIVLGIIGLSYFFLIYGELNKPSLVVFIPSGLLFSSGMSYLVFKAFGKRRKNRK